MSRSLFFLLLVAFPPFATAVNPLGGYVYWQGMYVGGAKAVRGYSVAVVCKVSSELGFVTIPLPMACQPILGAQVSPRFVVKIDEVARVDHVA